MSDIALDDDQAMLRLLSDRDLFQDVLENVFEIPRDEAREAAGRIFYHYMDPWGHLLDRVVDEGDPSVFSREDRRDLVALANLGIVAVRSTEVTKFDSRGRPKAFTQYHYALHLDGLRQRLVSRMQAGMVDALRAVAVSDVGEDSDDGAEDLYADPDLWTRRR